MIKSLRERQVSPQQGQIKLKESPTKQITENDNDYFQRVKSVYKGKLNRNRHLRNSQQKQRGHSQNTNINNWSQKIHSKGVNQSQDLKVKYKSSQQALSLLNSKLKTQSQEHSPQRRLFHNKIQKQRNFKNNIQNDRMMKRINEIKSRKNKYIKQAQQVIQFQKQHKLMHLSSIIANKKLQQMQRQQENDKFIDRLVERVKHKQTIKPTVNQKVNKSIKLDESRAKVAIGNRNFVQLPPMVFQ